MKPDNIIHDIHKGSIQIIIYEEMIALLVLSSFELYNYLSIFAVFVSVKYLNNNL